MCSIFYFVKVILFSLGTHIYDPSSRNKLSLFVFSKDVFMLATISTIKSGTNMSYLLSLYSAFLMRSAGSLSKRMIFVTFFCPSSKRL